MQCSRSLSYPISPRKISPRKISPGKISPRKISPRKIPPRKIPPFFGGGLCPPPKNIQGLDICFRKIVMFTFLKYLFPSRNRLASTAYFAIVFSVFACMGMKCMQISLFGICGTCDTPKILRSWLNDSCL